MPAERKLVVRDGDRVREVLLVGTVTVGRSPTCEISAADPRLSRTHATFNVVGDDVIVRDLESSNGTHVNGERITEHRLVAADTVEIGPFILRLAETAEAACRKRQVDAGDDEATVMMARRGSGAHADGPVRSPRRPQLIRRRPPRWPLRDTTLRRRLTSPLTPRDSRRPQRAAGSPGRPMPPTPSDGPRYSDPWRQGSSPS